MKKLDDHSPFPFGKFKGKKLMDVPPEFLIYLFENGKCYGNLKEYIADNLDVLKFQQEQNQKERHARIQRDRYNFPDSFRDAQFNR
jgi:uncharacterized protein (DUF3820 family)